MTIRAILFDLGGTLEEVYYDDAWRLQATHGFRDLLAKHGIDPGLSIPDLYAVLKAGMSRCQAWREASERELPPERVWSEFVFTDHTLPPEKLAAVGEELAFYWDAHFSHRALRPQVPALLHTLRARGFRLGVISNIISRGFVEHQLGAYGIRDFFDVVLASSIVGWRKPNPRIFLEAARRLNIPPAECAYVGDTISRDVSGARRAGYAFAIQIKSFLTAHSDRETDTEPPDAVIEDLMQIVELLQ